MSEPKFSDFTNDGYDGFISMVSKSLIAGSGNDVYDVYDGYLIPPNVWRIFCNTYVLRINKTWSSNMMAEKNRHNRHSEKF